MVYADCNERQITQMKYDQCVICLQQLCWCEGGTLSCMSSSNEWTLFLTISKIHDGIKQRLTLMVLMEYFNSLSLNSLQWLILTYFHCCLFTNCKTRIEACCSVSVPKSTDNGQNSTVKCNSTYTESTTGTLQAYFVTGKTESVMKHNYNWRNR